MLKSICQGMFVLGFSIALTSCGDFYETTYPAVTVSNPTPPPASSSMHYGPSAKPAASSSMHYGPSAPPSYPAVTVTNGSDASDSMHYGND